MMHDHEPWDGSLIMIVFILAVVGVVSIVGHIILFAVGALP